MVSQMRFQERENDLAGVSQETEVKVTHNQDVFSEIERHLSYPFRAYAAYVSCVDMSIEFIVLGDNICSLQSLWYMSR